MLSFFVLLLLALITVVVILVLRKNQQKHTKETADRTAPLPALDDVLPDFVPPPAAGDSAEPAAEPAVEPAIAKANDNWQLQVKTLRAEEQFEEALQVCVTHFPKAQAIQQAAIILRQQIKISQENNADIEQYLQRLYSLAALSDVYTDTRRKASEVTDILMALDSSREKYRSMGYLEFKLLNKSDGRLLEQMWGKPEAHRHAEEVYAF